MTVVLSTRNAAFVFALALAVCGGLSCEQPYDPTTTPSQNSGTKPRVAADASKPAPHGCAADRDCAESQYCAKPVGACEANVGTCADRSEMCTRDWRPVCGCDGKTYGNACGAASAGQNIDYEGECH